MDFVAIAEIKLLNSIQADKKTTVCVFTIYYFGGIEMAYRHADRMVY